MASEVPPIRRRVDWIDAARGIGIILVVYGHAIRGLIAADALAATSAASLQNAAELHPEGAVEEVACLEIEIYQAQTIIVEQVLEATSTLFNGLGASALSRTLGFDRFWRNARTLASHNPVIYKERLVGDYAVNGTPPPVYWIAGKS